MSKHHILQQQEAKQRANAIKHLPIAELAIAQHMVDHDLPPMTSMDLDGGTLRIRILGEEGPARWLNTLTIVEEHNEDARSPFGPGADRRIVRTVWTVRLPDSGVTFSLVQYRDVPVLRMVGVTR